MKAPPLRLLTGLLLIQVSSAALVAVQPVAVDTAHDKSNLYGGQLNAIGENRSDIPWVLILGHADSLDACTKLCVEFSNVRDPQQQCYSAAFFRTEQRFGRAGGCYGRTDPAWSPFPGRAGIDSVYIERPCEDNLGCSLNGKCDAVAGTCSCNHGWTGKRCQKLKLAPLDRAKIGFDPTADGKNMSSWGGSIQQVDGKWHMWASLLANHCGIGSYLLNSGVVHAISDAGVEGPYTQADAVYQPFCHEPVVVRAPTGELVMASVNGDYGTNFSACTCANGATSKTCVRCNNSCFDQRPTISVAHAVGGPWSRRDMFPVRNHGENPSIWIDSSGVAWGMGRGGMAAYSLDWRNASAWVHGTPGGKPSSIAGHPDQEDPMLYQDDDGNFHALLHSLDAPHYGSAPFEDNPVGQHAYSTDGLTWFMSGTAYSASLNTTDGGTLGLTRRERPHMVFAEGTRTPVALVNSALEGDCGGEFGDRSFTVVQGILP